MAGNSNNGRMRGIVSMGSPLAMASMAGPRAAAGEDEAGEFARATLAEMSQAFADFRDRNDRRVDELTAEIEQQAETIQALRIGGDPGNPGIHPGAGLRRGSHVQPLPAEVANGLRDQMLDRPNAGMRGGVDPDGGFTVEPQVDNTIDGILRDLSPMRSLARVVSMSAGNSWEKIIGRTGSQSGWAGEEDTRDDTDTPTLGKVSIFPEELYAVPQLTNHVLEDSSFDLTAFVTEDVAGEFSVTEGAAFVSGDGIKKPRGFLTRPVSTDGDATRTFGTLQYIATGNAGAFATSNPADKLHDLLTALKPAYRKGDGVAWLMNSQTANVIRKMKDGQGNYLWTNSIVAGQPDRLLGYPVALDEAMPDIGANEFAVAFGNWKRGYAIVDKSGMRLIVDRVTKKGWTKMYFAKRVGGGVVDSNAIKRLKFAAS